MKQVEGYEGRRCSNMEMGSILYTSTSTSELQANSLEESSSNTDLSLSDHDVSTTQDGFDTDRLTL